MGNGQHGTARWATRQEVKQTYHHVPYTPNQWRQAAKEGKQPTANGKPLPQGIVLGCQGGRKTTALVDSDDVHVLMIGASGVGKTAYFLYPNLEYACASGMSFLALDTKGDLARNYGAIARDIYGYRISVVDLREPTRSDGNNLLTLINRYMDDHREDPTEITAKAKAEKYAKILAKTIISPEGEGSDHGQNAYFYDAAEGLLASVVLLLSEFLPPEETDGYETRHIASVFKLVQELLMQGRRGGNQFQELMQLLPSEHKAKWLAGSALTASDQAMNSIMSTVLSRLNAFLDTELEQVLCFDLAFVVLALLYGHGDIRTTINISLKCGYDADCTCASAASIVGIVKGYENIGDTKGLINDYYVCGIDVHRRSDSIKDLAEDKGTNEIVIKLLRRTEHLKFSIGLRQYDGNHWHRSKWVVD